MRCRGVTVTELLVVVVILGIIALVAVPDFQSRDPLKLDLAAAQVAEAIRFARSETRRTGEAHGLTISQVTQKVTLHRYDVSTSPISQIATLYHPITKQLYDFNVNTHPSTAGVVIGNSQDIFNYKGLGRRRSLIFDSNGTPMWITGGQPYGLSDATVVLSLGNHQRNVEVASITGRVTVQ